MPTVRIDGLPEETIAVLRRRAAEAELALEEYVRDWMIAQASRPTVDEILDRIGNRSGGVVSFDQAARVVRDDRNRR